MRARAAEVSARDDTDLPYRIRDIAMDVGLLMAAATFTLLGGTGLLGHLAGITYPLSKLMVADAAVAGFLAGLCLLGWLFNRRWLRYFAAIPLALITLYTLLHNGLAGGPWSGESWLSGGPRILSIAALLLFLVALCTALGMKRPWYRLVWASSGLLALGAGGFSILLILLPASRLSWVENFVSSPILATLYALLGGLAFLVAAWRGSRRLLPLGRLTQLAAVAGVMVSCLAWYTLNWSAQSNMQRQAATLMDNAALNARHAIKVQLDLIQRLAWRQGLNDHQRQAGGWEHDVQTYFQHAPYLKTLALLNPDGELEAIRASSEQYQRRLVEEMDLSHLRDSQALEWSETTAFTVPNSPRTLLLVAPLGNAGGQLIAELDLAELLERELSVQLNQFRLSVGGDTPYLVLRQAESAAQDHLARPLPHLERREIGLPGGSRLVLDVHMDSVSGLLRAGIMPAGFAIAGLTLSYLLALSLGLVRLVLLRSRELMAARQRIEAQYDLEQRFRSLYLYHPDGVFSLDCEGRIVTANDACSHITGRPNETFLGSHFSTLLQPQDMKPMQELYAATLIGHPGQVILRVMHQDGHLRTLDVTSMPIIVDGVTQGVFCIAKDITQQHEQEAQLAYQATHDLLTGLPNHATFDTRLREAFEQAQQKGSVLVVMHLDLDGFKAINDGLGYHIGNQLLVAVADRLQQVIGQDATLARLTGDEFALLFTHLDGCQAGINIAERMLDALSAPFQIEDKPVHVSASIGIACNCSVVENAYELMQRADLAMSGAKQQGRNTWQWYKGNDQQMTEASVLLRHDLHTALKNNQFELYYQPIVEAVNGRIRGLEALIRWHHPEKGMISPGVFIPLAEQTGQIIPLGRWILQRVCQDAATLYAAGKRVVPVAVNISSLQFRRAGFLEDVQQALSDSGLPPKLLEIEVTESVLLDGAEQAIELINQLNAMGINVALDDFGTGFSSLSYLRDLPIHKVKLDRAFIKDITTNRRNAAIVQGIITMSHHLDLVVVAEGIEERDQQQDLVRRHCNLLQGFLFAKPMPLAAVMALPDLLPFGETTAAKR
ncbi:MAG: PAS/PAC and GAF sensor-containing diguanylate cyclase/phosphodiesterase [Halomonas sp. 54_146]|nr:MULTISPECIES: EAL domain-containing protein [unclassified Halomonas]KUJ89383.1 MAG: PAS/PAC and GAF sensor-containing diguanylate cyclase/phosphodiesterase [Halomonas sp. 54_146]